MDHISWNERAMDSLVGDSERVNCQMHEDTNATKRSFRGLCKPVSYSSNTKVVLEVHRSGVTRLCVSPRQPRHLCGEVLQITLSISSRGHSLRVALHGARLFIRPGSVTSVLLTNDDFGVSTKWHRLNLLLKWVLARPLERALSCL